MISYQPLREYMNYKGITIAELKEAGGFSSRTLAKISKDESITVDTIDRICLILGVPVERVIKIYGHNEVKPPLDKYDSNRTIISNNIKLIRQSRGLTQKEFAEIIGINQPVVSMWERGESKLTNEHLEVIKSKLNVTAEELDFMKEFDNN